MPVAELTLTLFRFHKAWAWVVIIANGGVGVWALSAEWALRLRGRALWVGVSVAHGAIGVQIILGVVMLMQGLRAAQFHIFYGVLLVVAPTLAYIYKSEPAIKRRVHLFYGVASLFFMGLGIRAYLQAAPA